MVVAIRLSPVNKGKSPKLSMLELVSVANTRYKVSKLRKRAQPPAFCYVCSRIDPTGLIRHPNKHLYRKGFFQACEHFPKPPDTTFIQDKGDGGPATFGKSSEVGTGGPSLDVTVRQGSRSTLLPSRLKRDSTIGSSVANAVSRQVTEHGNLQSRRSRDQQLPALPTLSRRHSVASSYKTIQTSKAVKTSDVSAHISKQPGPKSQTVISVSEVPSSMTQTRVTVIPTALEDRSSAELSVHSKSRSLSKTTLNSVSKNTFQGKESDQILLRENDQHLTECANTARKVVDSTEVIEIPYINPTDGLQGIHSPLIREAGLQETSKDITTSRPRAGLRRERHTQAQRHLPGPSGVTVHNERPDSGHLRYHHRMVEDSVPHPGFEIPPTPCIAEDTLLDLRRKEEEKDHRRKDASSISSETSTSKNPGSEINDEISLRLSDVTGQSCPTELKAEGRGFCRCDSIEREVSFTSKLCKTCGKIYDPNYVTIDLSRAGSERERSISNGKDTVSTRQKMLYGKEVSRDKSKAFPDQNFMDPESMLKEKDGRYSEWTSDDYSVHFEDSPFSSFKRQEGNINPLTDPRIHHVAYLKALNVAQAKDLQKNKGEHVFDSHRKLRRPNVFSYYSLLPYTSDPPSPQACIGLRQDNSVLPKNGQYMKHIFGDVRPDDFYGSSVQEQTGHVFVEGLSDTVTDKVSSNTGETQSTEREKDLEEQSSVSLRMKTLDKIY